MPDVIEIGTLNEVLDAASEVQKAVSKFLADHGVPGYAQPLIAGTISALYVLVNVVISGAVLGAVSVASTVATVILKSVDKAKQENTSEFNDVLAASLSEFFGVEISGSELPSGQGPNGAANRNAAIGAKVNEMLAQQLGGVRELQPQDGASNAKALTGFALNYAISAAFIGILTEAESLGFLKNFKDLGEDTAAALGLGRLTRQGLQPLIRNMVQQPYDLYLRSQTRPDRLTESQYIHGFHHGDFDEAFVRAKLAEKGYPDKEIDRLFLELAAHLAEADILRLIRYGDITKDEGVDELNVQGIPKITAQRLLRATELSRADSLVNSYVNKIESQYINGFIDEDTFNKLLDEVPWTDEEKKWERNFVGVTLDAPQTTLSYSQVKDGIVSGILDFDYLDRWMRNQGYSDEDQLYLEFDILQAMDQKLTKQQIATQKAARVSAQALQPKVAPVITRT